MALRMGGHRFLHFAAVALNALVIAAGCAHDERRGDGVGQRAPHVERDPGHPADPEWAHDAGLSVRIELAAGTRLDRPAQAELAVAARQFGITLAEWLYGDRPELEVEPVAPRLRRELASSPPYVPLDQMGSGDGHATDVHVSVQTSRSGVLVVTIDDSRTSYPVPASFERRAGRWRIVHLNTH